MEQQQHILLNSLDSLWFFDNIVSATPSPITTKNAVKTEASLQKPPSASTETERLCAQAGKDSEEKEVEEEEEKMEEEKEEICEATEFQEDHKQNEVLKNMNQRTEILRWRDCMIKSKEVQVMDLQIWLSALRSGNGTFSTDLGYENVGRWKNDSTSFRYCNLPSISDGLAMKQHIKLWAHAVACTVR